MQHARRASAGKRIAHHLNTVRLIFQVSCIRQVHIAYVEIYNEAGYDLLDPAREGAVAGFADLPRVGVLEDDEGRLHMRNLSLHCATTEEEALNLVSPRQCFAQRFKCRHRTCLCSCHRLFSSIAPQS